MFAKMQNLFCVVAVVIVLLGFAGPALADLITPTDATAYAS